jgi:hypothetical protein
MDTQRRLTFELLDQKIDDYVGLTTRNQAGPLERWSFYLALAAAGVGAVSGPLVGGNAGGWITLIALVVELAAFAVAVGLMVRREWAQFAKAERMFAQELDQDYLMYRGYVAWLREFPRFELIRRLRYVRDRKGTMSYRLGLFTGGIERLGVLPLLVALYLQFKDWEFGDWNALSEVNMIGGLLLWGLLLVYLGSWWLIGLRNRIEVYEALLADAVHHDDAAEDTL